MNAGNTTNAVQMRLKRIIRRLRHAFADGQPDPSRGAESTESENISSQRALAGAVRFSDEQCRFGGPDTVNKNPFFRAQDGRDCRDQQSRQQSSFQHD